MGRKSKQDKKGKAAQDQDGDDDLSFLGSLKRAIGQKFFDDIDIQMDTEIISTVALGTLIWHAFNELDDVVLTKILEEQAKTDAWIEHEVYLYRKVLTYKTKNSTYYKIKLERGEITEAEIDKLIDEQVAIFEENLREGSNLKEYKKYERFAKNAIHAYGLALLYVQAKGNQVGQTIILSSIFAITAWKAHEEIQAYVMDQVEKYGWRPGVVAKAVMSGGLSPSSPGNLIIELIKNVQG